EVVPPDGPDPEKVLAALESLAAMQFYGFSVATNPVAKPRMSALALCAMIQQRTKKPAILHLTTRDHNRLSLQGELWGARALGIETVVVATGDFVAFKDRSHTTTVRDADVYGLVRMARETGLRTGVVFDTHPESNGLARAVDHLKRKADAGAQFAVTQPVYDEPDADEIADATRNIGIPVIMGILPLRTPRHADFLHTKVAGIAVPEALRQRMYNAADPVAEGVANAREMVTAARQRFAGACIMPPFDHYEVMEAILEAGLNRNRFASSHQTV
ncbi:MAG: methylenetetrahydrofolate reductase, partial [Desulfosarcina sp.]|nr:methylenetetrahydrofolate reductase [Desulfosarcina sp.]MBC2766849.1 homocysteine methyltransferase [Desulfosarcina sp.]